MQPQGTLTITERDAWTVRVELAGAAPAVVTVVDPIGPRQEEDLRRHLEKHLAVAIAEPGSARRVAALIAHYGEALHAQLRATPEASRILDRWTSLPDGSRAVEVRAPGPLQRLHWELLREPGDDLPLAVRLPMSRTRKEPAPDDLAATGLRVLIVTARRGGQDIGVRAIRRPLLSALGSAVPVEILRPGTFEALAQALRAQPRGHYPVVHLDMHGRAGDQGGLVFFEQPGPSGVIGVEAAEVAALLGDHGVRLVVLNACQSSMPAGDETSVAALLVRAGVRAAVGMRYSITVDGAVRFCSAFYRALAAGVEVAAATRDARAVMFAGRVRTTALGIDTEVDDWLLPICHRAGPLRFVPAAAAAPEAAPVADLPGRDAVIMDIERRVTAGRTSLVVHGPIGVGKSELLRQLAAEWTSTGFAGSCLVIDFEEAGWDADTVRRRLPAAGRWALLVDHPHRARPADLDGLRALLAEAAGGANPPVAVLVADRHPGGSAIGGDACELPGLDPLAAYALARAALGDDRHRELLRASAYRRCLRILGGNPGGLRAIFGVLAEHDPRRVLAVLQAGELTGPDRTLRRLREGRAALPEQDVVDQLAPYTGPVAADRLPPGHRPSAFEPAHRAGLVTASAGGVVPHPLLGPVLRHELAGRPGVLAARRSAFLDVYLGWAASQPADRPGGPAAVVAEQENLQTALALALVAGLPETNLVRALDTALAGTEDRVALYDTVLTQVTTNPRQIIYRQQQVYALATAGRHDDAARAHERLLRDLDDFARDDPEAAASARPPILHSGARLALQRGDRTGAAKLLESALTATAVDGADGAAATHFELGRIALDEGRPRAARHHLEAAVAGMRQPPPRHAKALLTLARAERADGDPASAARHLEAARLESSTLEVLLEIISLAVEGGQLDAATAVLSDAVARVTATGDTAGLARLSLATGALAVARQDAGTAAASFERSARLAEQTGDPATAIDAYRRHAALVAPGDPGLAAALRRRADVLAADAGAPPG